jgi:hypothetical protein
LQRNPREKQLAQKDLSQFDDELRRYCEQRDGELFNRSDRLAMLENRQDNINSNSIFGAIFQELKNKSKQQKHKRMV